MKFCWSAGGFGWAGAGLLAVAVAGCGPSIKLLDDAAPDGGSEADGGFGTGDDATGGIDPDPGTTAMPEPGETGATFGDDGADDSETDGGVTFIDPVDTGCASPPPGYQAHCTWECDLWEQDCPRGEKCMPWANDGGGSWNAVRCSPIAADPAEVGEACVVEGNGVSGFDNCALGAMCFYVDVDTNEGICVAQCTGSPDEPLCEDGSACTISGEGTLAICLPRCNPLNDECPDGRVCVPNAAGSEFGCVSQVDDPLEYGEPCVGLNECGSGLVCANGEAVGCESDGCCAAFCDLSAGEPNPGCPDAADGQLCIPWFDEGSEPPGLESLGICADGPA